MRVLRTAAVAALAGCVIAMISSPTTSAAFAATSALSPGSTDFVALYYQLYKQQQQQGGNASAADTRLPPVVFKQNVPAEVQERLSRYALEFSTLPELLKRALLWERGYSIGDSESLAQIHTLCGLTMAELVLSDNEFATTACIVSTCKSNATTAAAGSDWRFSTACRPDQLLSAAKCASTAVDTVSSAPLWSAEPLRNTSESTLLSLPPDIRVRRHKIAVATGAAQVPHVYAIHASESSTSTSATDACRVDPITHAAAIVPCVPYQRSDTRWCRPAPSQLMTTWLDEYTTATTGTSTTNTATNATLQALDVANSSLAAAQTKDAHGVYVNAAFAFDGSTSDVAQQLYRRHVAGATAPKLIVQEPLPREIVQRLADASLEFDDLPPLLQRALVWDAGYVVANASSADALPTLQAVLVRCGLSMGDLAVPRERIVELASTSCKIQNCSTPVSGSSQRFVYSAFGCTDDRLARQGLCAVAATTLTNDSSSIGTPAAAAAARELPMWADGGDDMTVPTPSLQRHAWHDIRGIAFELFSIATTSTTTNDAAIAPSLDTGASQCATSASSIVIPCMSIASTSTAAAPPTWCRPRPSALVTSWLRQVAKQKAFSLLYLVPVLVAVALAVTGLAVYIRRKTFRRVDRKLDSRGTRTPTLGSLRDSAGVYVPTRRSSPHHVSGSANSFAIIDTQLATSLSPPASPSSSALIESFAAFSANHVLHTLVNDPALRGRTVAFDQLVFYDKLTQRSDAGDPATSPFEIWRASVRTSGADVAVKRLAQAHTTEFDALEALLGEITLNARIEHVNIAAFAGVAWTSLQTVCLLTEYVDGPDLRAYLQQRSLQLAWERAKMNIAMGVASALCCLHQLRPRLNASASASGSNGATIHGDVQSKHVLLTSDLDAKLIHAGAHATALATATAIDAVSVAAALWTAPEVLRGDAMRSERSDMYAFGILLAELDTHQLPFEEVTNSAVLGSSLTPQQVLQRVAAGVLAPEPSPFCPPEVADLIAACVHVDPKQRPSASEAAVLLAKVPIAVVGTKTFSF